MLRNRTAVCAIVKNEAPYLLEWIAYHRLQGFDEIILYSNDSADGTDDVLSRLQDAGVITYRAWPSGDKVSPQCSAYMDAVDRATASWICFIDIDEFLVLKADSHISGFLDRFGDDVSAIAMNWRVFGSAHRAERGHGLVIERFTRASEHKFYLNLHCKTIARAAHVKEMHIHRCFLKDGRYTDSLGRDLDVIRMGFTPTVEHGVVQINHYVVKSAEEFEEKRQRGNANRRADSADKYSGRSGDFFSKHDRNEEEDDLASGNALRVRMEIRRLEQFLVRHGTDGLTRLVGPRSRQASSF